MAYLFTSESVSEGHPDKVSDQISDAVLDQLLAYDPNSKVACETLVTTGQVVVAGEVKSNAYVDLQDVVRRTIARIGYTKAEYKFEAESCGIFSAIHEQSADINRGVDRKKTTEADVMNQGAGDQGMMFGYANNETDTYMPLPLSLAHDIVYVLAEIRREGKVMTYLRPDSKSQVTIEYSDENVAQRIDTIVVSTQHDEFISAEEAGSQEEADRLMQERIQKDVEEILIPRVIEERVNTPEIKELFYKGEIKYYVNPTGKFVIGGPHGDTGLTGRKIIVDTYGGKGAHGGGAFSGKDPSKVDRSAAYAARYIAKNMVAAGVADEMLVQLSYAIGKAEPISIYVDTYGRSHVKMSDGDIARKIGEMFDLRPAAIEKSLKLRQPIYEETASYGHMGRTPQVVEKTFCKGKADEKTVEVELFTWEKLDKVEDIKKLADEENNGKPVKVVANLPYYITTPIIMGLFENEVPVESITVMVQKEVADRMQTGPGNKDYGALSLAVQYYADPYIVANVPPNCFMPRPKVGSAVIRLTCHQEKPVQVQDEKLMFNIIRASFNQRRKTLANGLKNAATLDFTKEEVEAAIDALGKGASVRGETLTLEEFARLSDLLSPYKKG